MRTDAELTFIELSREGDREKLLPILRLVENFERIRPIRYACICAAAALGIFTLALAAFPGLFSPSIRHFILLVHAAVLAGLAVATTREWLLRRRLDRATRKDLAPPTLQAASSPSER